MMAPQRLSDRVHYAGNVFCMPITLLINFSLFQYLMGMFYKRRHEPRIVVLLVCAFVAFVVIIPFSHPDRKVYEHLDRVSEVCSVQTFLIQITVIGRDINRKMRIRTLRWLTYFGELLTGLGMALALAEFLEAVVPGADFSLLDDVQSAVEDICLAFIFPFRFYYVSMSKGVKSVIATRKVECFLYVLYATHQYPFLALDAWTNTDWGPVRAMWNRFTLLLCILHTIRDKIRASGRSSHARALSTNADRRAQMSSVRSGVGASSNARPSRGPSLSHLKAGAVRPALASRLPTWRWGSMGSVKPS